MEFLTKIKILMSCLMAVVISFNYSNSYQIQDNDLSKQVIIDDLDLWFRCPEGWVLNADSTKCLRVFNATQSWGESQTFCTEFGGDLASLHSEIDFLQVKTLTSEDTWIGLNDIKNEGVMEWIDSSPVDFTSWASGEPNNANGTENCVDLSKDANFDFSVELCSEKKRFICEKRQIAELPVYRCPQNWIMNSDSSKCFQTIGILQPWQESLNFCRTFGGDLASLHSENDFVLAKSLVFDDTWIGLNDIETEGLMEWSDSSPVDFTSWGSGEPDNLQDNENCVDLRYATNFDFDDYVCSENQSFLCQKSPNLVYSCPNGWIPNLDLSKCFGLISTVSSTWQESNTICRDFGAELASLHSESDLTLAKSLVTEDTWIGLNDIDAEGEFVWSDSSPVDYLSWASGEPNNGNGEGEDCVDLHSAVSFDFNDDYCTLDKMFLCEIILQDEVKMPRKPAPEDWIFEISPHEV